MRKIAKIFLCGFCVFTLFANSMSAAQTISYQQTKSYVVQFPFRVADDLPILEITANNQKMRLLLDTGASGIRLAITPSLLKLLNITVGDRAPVMYFRDAAGNLLKYRKVNIPSFTLDNILTVPVSEVSSFDYYVDRENPPSVTGYLDSTGSRTGTVGVEFDNVPIAVLDKTQGIQEDIMYSIDGIIGLETITSKADYLLLNLSEKYVTFFKGIKPDINLDQFSKIKYDDIHGFIQSHFLIANHPTSGAWDTGTNDTVINGNQDDHFAPLTGKSCPESLTEFSVCRYMDAAVVSEEGEQIGVSRFYLKNFYPIFDIDVIIGGTFFRNNLVVFDFRNHYVYVKKIENRYSHGGINYEIV